MKEAKIKLSESEKMNSKICFRESKTNSQDGYDRYCNTNFYLILKVDNFKRIVSLCEIDHKIINVNLLDIHISEDAIHYIANLESVSSEIKNISLDNFKDNYTECGLGYVGTSSIIYNPQGWGKVENE